jgi:hypothetical protein
MIKFPSIDQFRNVIRQVKERHDFQGKVNEEPVYQHLTPYPVIKFKGTVKLHGTNAGIVMYKDGKIQFQSRERVLDITQDNAGFMLSMLGKNIDFLFQDIEFEESVAIYGEWCGQGIQKGVAISELPKMFVIFACKIDGNWVEFTKSDPKQQIYNINDFKTWEIDIDFNNPELYQNQLIDWTLEVENECPVGKHFGVTGVGEGIVFKADWNAQQLIFKSKGEKHSSSKVKTISSVNVDEINSINEFITYVLTDSRLNQGIEKLKEAGKEISQKSTGDFLRWIVNDVIKEEQDTIVENQLDVKKINSAISNAARIWYFKNF